jgi:class 3 adenylate cyclase/ActR/RegA family two-component response regulator
MTKILVVDDEIDLETLIKQKFRLKIRQKEYDFIFAVNGNDALDQLEQHPDVDVMLCDINMPGMDGLTLLSKLKETNTLVKAIIVSAYGDMGNIRTAMNRGAFDFITKPINFEDLEVTMQKTMVHVSQLRQTIQAIKENSVLRMYVDETVLNFMSGREFESTLANSEAIEATVAFIDICDFFVVTESESPDTTVKTLNVYFDIMAQEIVAQGGYIDKFVGDAIMAVFRGDYHLDKAIEACLSLRRKIEAMPKQELSFTPKLAIGINSGPMISGNIGSANLKRLDYTVVGEVVNAAHRLQNVAEPGQILINESTYQKVKASFNCGKLVEIALKNNGKPVAIYNVMD